MSKSWDDLVARVDGHDRAIEAFKNAAEYPSLARKKDEDLARGIERAGSWRETTLLRDIRASVVSFNTYVHAWDGTYDTGGETIPDLTTLVDDYVGAFPATVNGYSATFDGVDKLLAYTTAGTEVAAMTDLLTAIGSTPILVVGRTLTDLSLDVHTSRGGEALVEASVRIGRSAALDGTDFWTIGLWKFEADSINGVRVGEVSNSTRFAFTAGKSYSIKESTVPLALTEGARLVLVVAAATEDALPLGDVTMSLDFRKAVI